MDFKNIILYFDYTTMYFKDDKVQFEGYIFKAKKNTFANCPPKYPLEENEFWIID